MDWSHLVTNKKLQEMIKEMGAVKSFSYDVTATGSKGSTFRALMPGHVKTETKRFVFKKGTAPWSTVVGLAAKVIPGFVKKRGIERGKIVGEDAQGERSVINIVSNLQVYDHRDYDDSMAGLEIAPDEFMENDLFEWLLAEVQRNRAAL